MGLKSAASASAFDWYGVCRGKGNCKETRSSSEGSCDGVGERLADAVKLSFHFLNASLKPILDADILSDVVVEGSKGGGDGSGCALAPVVL